MSFLVDTCALSELFRPSPNPGVTVWFEDRVLAVDLRVADEWGRLLANATRVREIFMPGISTGVAASGR